MKNILIVLALICLMSIHFVAGLLLNEYGVIGRDELHKCEKQLPRGQRCEVVITAVPVKNEGE